MRLLAGLAIAGVILVALGFKAIFVSNPPAAGAETKAGISIYDIHLNHPDIKNLPVQDIPPP